MKKIVLKNIVWREGPFYVAQCLNIDVSSFGRTKISALKNLHQAVSLYFEAPSGVDFSEVKSPELFETRL